MIFFLVIFLVIVFVGLFIGVSALFSALKTGVPFVNTPSADIKFIVKELAITKKDVFYDLGSGYGKTAFLVEKFTGSKVVGFEQALWAYLLSVFRSKIFGLSAQFVWGDFLKANWSKADYIYAYLFPPVMQKIEQKFLYNAGAKTRLIVRDFPLPNLQPILVYKRPLGHCIFVYVK